MSVLRGTASALVSSVSFGLIPLFTLPVLAGGTSMDSVICYRFTLAALFIGLLMLARRESFRVKWSDVPFLVLVAVFYDISSLFLLWAYDYLGSGIATILHFTYPVLTTVIMMTFFGEKASVAKIAAIVLAVAGVVLLSAQKGAGSVSAAGVLIAVLSGLGYALYMVSVNVTRVRHLGGLKLAFYVFLIGDVMLLGNAWLLGGGVELVSSASDWINLVLLALVCTIVSNQALIVAIKDIGSVMTSVFGALEPVTAVLVGIIVFGEAVTGTGIAGMAVILVAVVIIVCSKGKNP